MLDPTSGRLRVGFAAAVLAAALGAAGLAAPVRGGRTVASPTPIVLAPVALPDSLTFEVQYAGQGAEGVDLVWRGLVGGAMPGRATIRMEYAGPAADRKMPIWPVNAWFFFSADDLRASFAAELSGSMNWRTGDLRVTGLVSDGVGIGTPLEQRMRVEHPGLAGRVRVRFFPGLAAGARKVKGDKRVKGDG